MSSQRVGAVRAQLDRHRPLDAPEARSLARTRRLLTWLAAPLDEHADPTHVTGSAIVLDERSRVLLHRHKRLGRWLQPGGHLDPGELPWQAAVRETREETGLDARHPAVGVTLVHVDVHEGPRGHVHLDLRYLLLAEAAGAFSPASGESQDVAWFSAAEVAARSDASTQAAVAAALAAHAAARAG
ncbi:MAG: NUDIX hydrolase [Nitriliruptoraceae bacterium]